MTLIELIRRADKGYTEDFPESSLLELVDQETGRPLPDASGDTLTLFVVRELGETFDPDAADEEQLPTARRCIENAVHDLGNILTALDD